MVFSGRPLPDRSWLSAWATGRDESLFSADLEARHSDISAQYQGSRVLVVGGAGSIGSQTVARIADFAPETLHVVDLSENGLAELVRDLRSREGGIDVPDLLTAPLDFGSEVFRRFLRERGPYDHVLNFAAIKHVRSERDLVSVLQMFETNVIKPLRLLDWLEATGGTKTFFTVSTDKAANPVNLMGASKRIMEEVVFRHPSVAGGSVRASAARFANVAFSDGSLLDSWIRRLQREQPLAVPANVVRFLVSLEESGQLCLLASSQAPNRTTVVPRGGQLALLSLADIARGLLVGLGLEPAEYRGEAEAWLGMASDVAEGRYPLLLTELDTSGEKPFEEFVAEGETTRELDLASVLGIPWCPVDDPGIHTLLEELHHLVNGGESMQASKAKLVELVRDALPRFEHVETGKSLDERM